MSSSYYELCAAVTQVVREVAAQVVMPRYLRVVREHKADGTIFTEVDIAAQQALIERLQRLRPRPVLGEEEMSEAEQHRLWDEGAEGLWVDRLEGDALRAWLATARAHRPNARGVSAPVPYRHEGPPASAEDVRAGLDLVLMELDRDGVAPTGERGPGDSVAEWAWLDADQVELLRRRCLVQVEGAP